MYFIDDLLFDGFDILLSLMEALEPLSFELPSFVVVVVMVDDVEVLCPISWIERYVSIW
ncbi:unnamed protein product [Penicillium salamii]|nr:unnamed protein product [Penicillium salamii]CAG8249700.1 unnamed protein product [Penicillium salamii]